MNKINSLITTINSIDIDVEAPAPDFNIYTENNVENKLFGCLQTIIDNIEELSKTRNVYPAPLVSGFNGMLQFCFQTNKIVPYVGFIKGDRQRF